MHTFILPGYAPTFVAANVASYRLSKGKNWDDERRTAALVTVTPRKTLIHRLFNLPVRPPYQRERDDDEFWMQVRQPTLYLKMAGDSYSRPYFYDTDAEAQVAFSVVDVAVKAAKRCAMEAEERRSGSALPNIEFIPLGDWK